MKVFISNVDTPIGHHLSRHFHLSPVTIKNNDEDQPPPETDEPDPELLVEQKSKDFYQIFGSLTNNENFFASLDHHYCNQPGLMVYTGDKKKDFLRKEAIEKFSVVGVKPSWVEGIVQVYI